MTITWSFSYNSFIKFHVEKIGSHSRTVLYLSLCYNKVCYEGTVLNLFFVTATGQSETVKENLLKRKQHSIGPYPTSQLRGIDLYSKTCVIRPLKNRQTKILVRERSGSVVECLTGDRGAAGLSLTGVTVLWSLSKTHLS